MTRWQFTKGLHEVGQDCWAYIQPDGSWGWSNAGLIIDGDQSVLVDTLFDLKLTREMLDTMKRAVPAAKNIGTLINTHANADHTNGNQLLADAEIIGTEKTREDMYKFPPEQTTEMLSRWKELGEAGAYLHEIMGDKFDFTGVNLTPPHRTFIDRLSVQVGDKEIQLVDLGPAHTGSDIVAYVPKDKLVFTGDLVFANAHPAVWSGPVANWIAACDEMLKWDIETIVPGHGPITDKQALFDLKEYFEYLTAETRAHFNAGRTVEDAARAILGRPFKSWGEEERVFINVEALYRDFVGALGTLEVTRHDAMEIWAMMGRYHRERTEGGFSTCPAGEHDHV